MCSIASLRSSLASSAAAAFLLTVGGQVASPHGQLHEVSDDCSEGAEEEHDPRVERLPELGEGEGAGEAAAPAERREGGEDGDVAGRAEAHVHVHDVEDDLAHEEVRKVEDGEVLLHRLERAGQQDE
eukprot:CAMPEP_0185292516 /NCGR_PEP_ID=MMETSP1363-20130426/6140_1 /TAXON_ID=38817 /ORGANISM="Gephyrocapsa oceanica, Strain RCC1303" /LENGTH=126 /DNA_ID=CAMNT_0027888777 /DNA_START=342 /DNA_END=718 /DNA_ORIENTATION=+